MNTDTILVAMKADSIPDGESGLWYITKTTLKAPFATQYHGKDLVVRTGNYTHLYRITDSTLFNQPPGEVVMEDTDFELQTHLDFVMHATGRVLVSGLGLGCVVRGLLANPDVLAVTCLENSLDVLKMVAPYMPTDRLTIVYADALEWTANNKTPFDCAWHDVWTNRDNGEPHLDHWHTRLLINCKKTVPVQGAWALDRRLKKMLVRRGFNLVG